MTKIDAAIALARNAVGTLSTMSVLIGPVGRKNRNIAAPRQTIDNVDVRRQKSRRGSGHREQGGNDQQRRVARAVSPLPGGGGKSAEQRADQTR